MIWVCQLAATMASFSWWVSAGLRVVRSMVGAPCPLMGVC
ncbi:hypothetical protein AHiyo1_32250 [Arthrobacter sp. Hiyo1]|nr:hypothetical protein AHiyo1_32250 [Arthrobacter sp. Hiyo1]